MPGILIVFDKSGSMNDTLGGGARKLDYAKNAVRVQLSGLSENTPAGLIMFPQAGPCNTAITVGMGPKRIGQIQRVVGDLQEGDGDTPLAAAIDLACSVVIRHRAAVRVIVLTDGEETCGGDPLAAATSCRNKGVDIEFHIVGFAVSDSARHQLNAIAKATGGQYYDARDADQLDTSLAEAFSAKIDETKVDVWETWISNRKGFRASQNATSEHKRISWSSFYSFARFKVDPQLAAEAGEYTSTVVLGKEVGDETEPIEMLAQPSTSKLTSPQMWIRRQVKPSALVGGKYKVLHTIEVGGYHDGEFVILEVPGPDITIRKVRIKHKAMVKNQRGVEFSVNFRARNYRAPKGRILVFIHDLDGDQVTNNGMDEYISSNGFLYTARTFHMKGRNQSFNNFKLGIPYGQFWKGDNNYYGLVQIQDPDGKSWVEMRTEPFRVSRKD